MTAQSTVLVVEDNEDFQNLYGMLAEEAGYKIERIFNGLEAIARLEKEPLPAIVLLDSRLPGASGMEILKAARAKDNWSQVPIYIMTADLRGAQEFRMASPAKPHPDGVIEKGPDTIHELRALFKNLKYK
jgi:CheY-like chemotaxis protein